MACLGTERYIPDLERKPGPIIKVREVNRELRLEFTDNTEPVGQQTEYFPLPRFFEGPDQLRERSLDVYWERGPATRYVLAQMLCGFDTYIRFAHQGLATITAIKSYQEVPHGADADDSLRFLQVSPYLSGITQEVKRMCNLKGGFWTGGFSGEIWISPWPDTEISPDTFVYPSGGFPSVMTIPMMDLNITYSGDAESDLKETAKLLASVGFSGWLAVSGDPGKGGFHYIADFIMDYFPYFWKIKGVLLKILTPKGEKFAEFHNLSDQLITATTLEEARAVAIDIGTKVLPDYPDETRGDYRWVRRRVLQGVTILRSEEAKDYKLVNFPYIVARIK
jgi:hypothetical protein